jgi:LPXTG-site transpeptidase (sortase) family protein
MRFESIRTRFDSFLKMWREAPPLRRGLIVAVPVVILALAGTGIGFAAFHGGGNSNAQAHAAPTSSATAAPEATPTLAPLPTETPSSAGVQANPGGGAPPANYQRVQPRGGSGPGAARSTGISLSIPSVNVNASVYSRTVGTNGVMGNPSGAWDVIWYDFSALGAIGGYPGDPGANAVFAGHVDYIHVGPAVFWNLRSVQPGTMVYVNTPNGQITYRIQWSQWAAPDADFGQYVSRTGQDVITLVTCIGDFSNGHYSNRLVVRGVRV